MVHHFHCLNISISRWQGGKFFKHFFNTCTVFHNDKSYRCRPAIPHAFRVRLQQLPSPMRDTRLRLLPYFQNIFALIAPTLYMLSLSKNCPNLNFHCPIFQSHAIALLLGWQVCTGEINSSMSKVQKTYHPKIWGVILLFSKKRRARDNHILNENLSSQKSSYPKLSILKSCLLTLSKQRWY